MCEPTCYMSPARNCSDSYRYMRVMFYLATPGAPERVIPTKPE